jgi:dihydroxyacetone kinase-like predicted kinase
MFVKHYHLEFILNTQSATPESIKSLLTGLTEAVDIFPLLEDKHGHGKNFKIQVKTKEPELIFDVCSQFGRLKSVKVSEAS